MAVLALLARSTSTEREDFSCPDSDCVVKVLLVRVLHDLSLVLLRVTVSIGHSLAEEFFCPIKFKNDRSLLAFVLALED